MIYILVAIALLIAGITLFLPVSPCSRCRKRRSLLVRFISLDNAICDDCLDIINQEIRNKRSSR